MLGLLRQTLRPTLLLRACVEDWRRISLMLREAPRRRQLQIERLSIM